MDPYYIILISLVVVGSIITLLIKLSERGQKTA